ncbi:MAG: hypothetical protein ACI4RC_04690 [Oscillospiraceae bacterium]
MSKMKIIVAAMVLSVCVFSFASCGKNIKNKNGNESGVSQTTTAKPVSVKQAGDSSDSSGSKQAKNPSQTTTAKVTKSTGTTSTDKNGFVYYDQAFDLDESTGEVVTNEGESLPPNMEQGWEDIN